MSEVVEPLKNLTMENHIDEFNGLSKENSIHNKEDTQELQNKFSFVLAAEEAVSLDKSYILGICATCDPQFRIVTALSNYSCNVYSVGDTLTKIAELEGNGAPIVGVRFSPTHHNLLYTAASNGYITLYDIRSKTRIVTQFKAENCETEGKLKSLASFDIALDERVMASGTELIEGDAFILFWDTRYPNSKSQSKKNLLGGYWQSHTDDVTTLAFHPNRRDILASGSTDGLVNIFDLIQPTEDAALMHSLNTESSVDRLGWMGEENFWCATHTHSLQLWNVEGAAPTSKFDRETLAISQAEDPEDFYLVKMHMDSTTGQNFLLAGCSTNKRESLRCLTVRDNTLETCCNMSENKQTVRDSWFSEKNNYLVTGGESSIVSIWKKEEACLPKLNWNQRSHSKNHKVKGRDKLHKAKPY